MALVLELAPRLVNEQMIILPTDRRTLTYKRVIRFPEGLRVPEDQIVVPKIPDVPKASTQPGKTGTQPATTEVGGAAGGAGARGLEGLERREGRDQGGNPFGAPPAPK